PPRHAYRGGSGVFGARGAKTATERTARQMPAPVKSELDRFVMGQAPFAHDLAEELSENTRRKRALAEAQSVAPDDETLDVTEARPLSEDETIVARKILACVARAGGRFGKHLIAGSLRGSQSAKVSQAGLNQLSTYGILRDHTQDEILLFIDALVAAGALAVSGGAYPTISLSALGDGAMRGRAALSLALPDAIRPQETNAPQTLKPKTVGALPQVNTVDETHRLYREGLTIEQIAEQRGLTGITIEKHLADSIIMGRDFDVSRYVSPADRDLIAAAIARHGAALLKPLRDALPPHVTYRMIRFVVAAHQRAAASSNPVNFQEAST
ncbi:MAG: helix-turn-helix domain-containing protein, partial [Pyrinomonadaceae bacterium]